MYTIEWITFEPTDDLALLKAARALQNEAAMSNDHLAVNYATPNFVLEEQIAISLGKLEDKFVAITSLAHRPLYGNGVLRTMNRFWKSPSIRLKSNKIKKSEIYSLQIIPQHIKIASKYNFNCLFISRQNASMKWFKKLETILSNNLNCIWTTAPHKIQVCNAANSSSCWQHVVYSSLDGKTLPNGIQK